MKMVGGDAFYSYHILYHYSLNFKYSPKISKNTPIVKHYQTKSSTKALQIKETFKAISILF